MAQRAVCDTQPIRRQPARNKSKRLDDDFVYQTQNSRISSFTLGSTISNSILEEELGKNSLCNIVSDTQPIEQGNDSLSITDTEITMIPETQDTTVQHYNTPHRTSEYSNTTWSKWSSRMRSLLSQTVSSLPSTPSLLRLTPNSDLRTSTPIPQHIDESFISSDSSPPLVTSLQLPSSQPLSDKYENVIKQLIIANSNNTRLEQENKQLREELLVSRAVPAVDTPNNAPCQSHTKTKCNTATQTEKETQVDHPVQETALFRFRGNLSVLSNFHMADITFEGKKHRSAEHAYQHSMAMQNHRPDVANKIASVSTSTSAKALTKNITKCSQWHTEKTNIMADILYAKASQCREFRISLLKTGQKRLVHNIDTDDFWGCGPDLKGLNMMGVLLEELRSKLQKETGAIPKAKAPSIYITENFPSLTSEVASQTYVPHQDHFGNHLDSKSSLTSETSPQTNELHEDHHLKHVPSKSSSTKTTKKPNTDIIPQSPTSPQPPVLIIGNSNARDMTRILSMHHITAKSFCYPGASIELITDRIHHTVSGPDPSHVVLMVGDVEAANGMSAAVINNNMQCLIRETQRVYPWSRIILVELAITGHKHRRQTIQRVNAYIQHIAHTERLVTYVRNKHAKLCDRIHLTHETKTELCHSITNMIIKPYSAYMQKFH